MSYFGIVGKEEDTVKKSQPHMHGDTNEHLKPFDKVAIPEAQKTASLDTDTATAGMSGSLLQC